MVWHSKHFQVSSANYCLPHPLFILLITLLLIISPILYLILTPPLLQYLCYLVAHTSYTLPGSKDSTWYRIVYSVA